MASLTTEYREVMELLDLPCKNSGLTVTQMVMDESSKDGTKRLFVSVDSNTYSENINFAFFTKYYKESHNRMVRIGPSYLYKEHGYSILQFFSPLEK